MSNKKIYTLFLVLFILLVGLSVATATDTNETETTVKDTTTDISSKTTSSTDDYAYNITGNNPIKHDSNQRVKSDSKSIKKIDNIQSKGEDNLLDLNLSMNDTVCNYGDYVKLNVTTNPVVDHGVISWFVNGRLVGVNDLSKDQPSYTIRTAGYVPGNYTIMASYSSSLIYINNQTTAKLTINKLNTSLTNLDYQFNENNNIDFSLNIMDSKNNLIDIGYLNIYNGTDKIREIEIEDTDILFTLPGIYNTETLRFEFEGDEYYNPNNTYQLINIPLKNLNISTNKNITAYVGDIISVPFSFNESVNDGKLSISYGGSPDNIIDVTSGVNSISFDTTGYLQGEYLLVLRYYDSHIFNINTTSTTLYLYQPSNIIADKDNVNVILGKGNEYIVNFETGLDQWDDVIWGSIDIYIDNKIIGTLIIDDITGNTSSITLDDYNLEDLTPGTHTLTAIFNTDDQYIETSSTTVALNVGGDVELTLPDNITVMTTDSIVIPLNTTFNNQRLNVGNLTFYIDDVQVGTLDLSTGRNNITVTNSYNPGTYNIRVNYTDNNGIYTNTSNTTTLYVRSTTSIVTSVLNDTIRNTTFTVSLRDARGNNFDGLVNITLPGGTIRENVAVTNGIATLTFDDLTVGSNTFTITYPGNTIYDASTATLTVSVVKLNSTTSATVTNASVRNTTITVSVSDTKTGQAVTSGTVEIINTDNNAVVGTGTLDNTGTITITTTLNIQDDYNLRVDYKGNSEYNTSSTLLDTITVMGRISETTVNVNNNTYQNTSITVSVKDPVTDTVITNAPITITLQNGDSINSNTGSTGTVTISLDLPVGTNPVTVEFIGNDEYNSSTNTKNIVVNQRESVTTAIVTNSSVRNTTLNVTVRDKTTGNVVTNGDVKILDKNGNTIGTGSITSNGNATITTTIDSKDVTELTVNYLGNTNYSGSTYSIDNLVVVGRLSDIVFLDNNLTFGNVSVNVTVKDPVTDTPIGNAPVKITYTDGTVVETITDANGNITLTPDLAVGSNTITVEFLGNDEYNSTIQQHTFTVTLRESSTTATITNATVRNTTVIVTVTDKITGEAVTSGNIEVIDTSTGHVIGRGSITDANPVSIITNIDTTGTYNLRVDYKGNTNYTSSSYSLDNVVVGKRESKTIAETVNNVYNSTVINVTVKDPVTGTVITNAPVTITYPDGTTYNTNTGSTGTVEVALNIPVGSNTITVEYSGNNDYNASDDSVTIDVQKRASITTATVTNSSVRNTTISVTVTDAANNNPITIGQVEVIDTNTGNTVGSGTLSGSNSIEITTNIAQQGTYDLLVRYNENNYYNSSTSTLDDVTVTGRLSEIETNINNKTNGNISINVTLDDPITDTPIPNAPITVTYPDGTTETLTTDADGNITITHDLPVGSNTLTIEYNGNTDYNGTTTTITVNVDKRESITRATLTNNTIGNTTINVRVTDKTTGNVVTSGLVEVINAANNAVIARGTLNGEDINITANINTQGTYNLIVRYNGNTNYTGSEDTLDDVNIEKRASTLIVTTVDDIINNTQITITVKDPVTGEVITNAPISIILPNNTVINTHTGSTGIITQTLTLPAGENIITVEYSGSNTYNTSTTTHTLDIRKLASRVTLTRMTAYLGDTITLTATVTDMDNKALTGGKLVFKLNDVTLKDNNGEAIYTTVENGIASITYNVPVGYTAKTYKLTAVYEGNPEHDGSRSTAVLLNLKQRQARLTLTCQETVSVGNTINFHVTIADKHDTNRNIDGYVIFKIDGKTLTDNNGNTIEVPVNSNTADYTFTVTSEYSARKHTVTVVLGNGSYVRSQAENTFNITQAPTRLTINKPNISTTSLKLTGTITDNQDQPVTGINKVAVKIDGVTLKDENRENIIFLVNNGNIDIDYPIDPTDYPNDSYNVEVVTGERSAYTAARTTTTLTNTKTVNKKTEDTVKTATITTKQLVNLATDKTIAQTKETNTITITAKDTNNKKIKKGKITFTYKGKTLATSNIKNGIATLDYKFNKAGTYKITATYTDNTGTYQETSIQFNAQIIEKPKETTKIIANNTSTTVGETLTYTSLFYDNYNNKITEGTAKITINKQTTTQKITNGMTITPITLNTAGKYNITITSGNTKITRTITVNKKTPKVSINKITATAGTTANVTIHVKTEKGTPLDGKITIKLNNETKTITAKDGKATTTLTIPITQAQKNTTLTATYTGNNYYKNKTVTTTFIPAKKGTILTLGNTNTTTIGNNITIYGKLTDSNGKNLANQKITIKINGKTYNTNTTKYGNYNIKITPNKTGTNTITATYNGNTYYTKSTNTSTTTINKKQTILTLGSTKTTTIGNTISIYGKLTDNTGKNLAYEIIKINVNGKIYTTTTTKYGNYKINITANTIGKNNITSTYSGSTNYRKSTNKTNFTTNKIKTTITVGSTKTVSVDKHMSIYGKLTDNSRKNLANQVVTINVDGKTYTINTTKYGNYNIKITPTTTGTKTITSTYKGTNIYNNTTATSTFKVVKT